MHYFIRRFNCCWLFSRAGGGRRAVRPGGGVAALLGAGSERLGGDSLEDFGLLAHQWRGPPRPQSESHPLGGWAMCSSF